MNWSESIRSHFTKQTGVFFFLAVGIYCLFFSRYTISIAMFFLLLLSLGERTHGTWRIAWRKENLPSRGLVHAMGALCLFFIVPLVSGFWSSNQQAFWSLIRVKLPFLFLPIAFMVLPGLTKRQLIGLFYVLLLTSVYAMCWVLWYYWQDPTYYNLVVKRGGSLETPVNHVRFSLLIGIATTSSFILVWTKQFLWCSWERFLQMLIGVSLFVFLHVLAVRTGIVTTYISIIIILVYHLWRMGRPWILLASVVLLLSLPYGAYRLIPSFYQKVNYTLTDMQEYLRGEGQSYSDATRIRSFLVGWDIFLDHPYIGIGAGDVHSEAKSRFARRYPASAKYVSPHNQWITILAGTGLFGFIILLAAFLQPLVDNRSKDSLLFLNLYVMVGLSLLVENTFNNSVGVAIFLFFTLACLSYTKTLSENTFAKPRAQKESTPTE